MSQPAPVLTHGEGSLVHTVEGRTLIDLTMGFGAVFLGHGHPEVTRRLQAQAGRLMSCGRHLTADHARVETLLAAWLPAGLRPAGLYSTGMEAAEFAVRVAATHTGRDEFAGFARGMHGKSALTAALCWPDSPVRAHNVHVLPFVDQSGEEALLDALERLLAPRRIAALFIEPIQGSNAAHEASARFYAEAIALCRAHGTLCVLDEILTGLHRTGPRFYAQRLAATPDVLLYAKALGNGFPVSGVAVADPVRIRAEALPGSTFSGNPMALAAAEATLTAMADLPMADLVAAIEAMVRESLGPGGLEGASLRGRGALWCLEFPDRAARERAGAAILEAGILANGADRFIRLLPAATIEPARLREACARIARACA